MAKEATEDPGKFAGSQAGGWFVGMLIAPSLFVLSFLVILFVFGFTTFLGGPYLFFKVLFFLSIFATVFVVLFLIKIYKIIKALTKTAVDNTIKGTSKIIE